MSSAAPSSPGNSGTFDSLPPVKGPKRKTSFRERSVLASESRTGLAPAMAVSIAAHVAMFGGALAWAHYTPPRVVPEKPIVAKLVRLGKPRDEKLLPRLPTAPPPPPPAAPPAPVVAPPVETPPLSPTAKTVPVPPTPPATNAATREETPEERRKRMMNAFNSLGPTDGPTSTKPEDLPGRADGDAAGTADDAAEGDRYLAQVVEALKRDYKLPTTITARERLFLSCKLRLFIAASGEVERYVIEQGSGNEQYDRAVEATLQRAKLPPPPAAFTSRFGNSGVGFDFKP